MCVDPDGCLAITVSLIGLIVGVSIIFGLMLSEHTKNKRPSSRNKHEKGQTQRQRERRGGEKGDARRPYQKKKRGIFSLLIDKLFNNIRTDLYYIK